MRVIYTIGVVCERELLEHQLMRVIYELLTAVL